MTTKQITVNLIWGAVVSAALILGILSMRTVAGLVIFPAALVSVIFFSAGLWKRWLLHTGGFIASIIVLIYVYAFAGEPTIRPILERRKAIELLGTAKSPQELKEAAGRLGLVLNFPDKSWLAIRYRDSHSWPGWSLAVAMDSEGQFYESHKHYCGTLRAYERDVIEFQRELTLETNEVSRVQLLETLTNAVKSFAALHQVASSANLEAARSNLPTLGFSLIKR